MPVQTQKTSVLRPGRGNALYCRINVWPFVGVMIALLILFLPWESTHRKIKAIELPRVRHAREVPWALREDAMKISIQHDGRFFFGNAAAEFADLSGLIKQGVRSEPRPEFILRLIRELDMAK